MQTIPRNTVITIILLLCLGGWLAWQKWSASTEPKPPLLTQIKNRGALVAGIRFDAKPFGYLDADGTVKGYDIDLIREIATRLLGSPDAVEFRQVLASTRVIALNSGNLDIVAATMTITPQREDYIDFSDVYYEAGQAVIVPANNTVQTIADLQDKTLLYVMGTTGEKTIKQTLPTAKFLGFKTNMDAFSALIAGRGDAMTTDDTMLSGLIKDRCDFTMLPQRLSKEPYGLGIRQNEPNHNTQSFRQTINQLLADMKQDGTLDKLQAKWLGPTTNVCHSREGDL
ncbi:MAG: transporter substrate-binding domain-containing protein [Vampirovibrio sp.]|nr:transporter substrate-binding domain-containing protein [Vampirovibrio sp.]